MKFNKAPAAAQGPSSSIGIMRFFDTDAKGPKLSMELVFGVAIAFIIVMLAVRFLFFKGT